jgi:hypothetical protein
MKTRTLIFLDGQLESGTDSPDSDANGHAVKQKHLNNNRRKTLKILMSDSTFSNQRPVNHATFLRPPSSSSTHVP